MVPYLFLRPQFDSSSVYFVDTAANSRNPGSNSGTKKEVQSVKDLPGVAISAQTFTYRELAAATKNFRDECFLGEGGFGCVYKGQIESTGQVSL